MTAHLSVLKSIFQSSDHLYNISKASLSTAACSSLFNSAHSFVSSANLEIFETIPIYILQTTTFVFLYKIHVMLLVLTLRGSLYVKNAELKFQSRTSKPKSRKAGNFSGFRRFA